MGSRFSNSKGALVTLTKSEFARHMRARNRTTATHKFPVGAFVLHKFGARSEKAVFRVTRQLPDGGLGLQYRIKGERDGVERVVTESELERGS
jgi:hypothetical protein